MKVVVDASVAIKWLFSTRTDEADLDKAMQLLAAVGDRACDMFQPVHFQIEVLSVMARLEPAKLDLCIGLFDGLFRTVPDHSRLMRTAGLLAVKHRHHLFDTLYHAVALEEGATLVTADEAYFAKARGEGGIVRLMDFAVA